MSERVENVISAQGNNLSDRLDMFPGLAPDGAVRGVVANGNAPGDGRDTFACGAASAHLAHQVSGEPCCRIGFTSRQSLWVTPRAIGITERFTARTHTTAFEVHVAHVYGLGCQEQMAEAWILHAINDVDTGVVVADTGAVIAGMQNSAIFGYGSPRC